jgi:hypothetical protein
LIHVDRALVDVNHVMVDVDHVMVYVDLDVVYVNHVMVDVNRVVVYIDRVEIYIDHDAVARLNKPVRAARGKGKSLFCRRIGRRATVSEAHPSVRAALSPSEPDRDRRAALFQHEPALPFPGLPEIPVVLSRAA